MTPLEVELNEAYNRGMLDALRGALPVLDPDAERTETLLSLAAEGRFISVRLKVPDDVFAFTQRKITISVDGKVIERGVELYIGDDGAGWVVYYPAEVQGSNRFAIARGQVTVEFGE